MKVIVAVVAKFLIIGALLAIVIARLFFPKTLEESVIVPARRMPVFGQILGATWERLDAIGPSVQQRTVSLADTIEHSDLGIDEAVLSIVESEDPTQHASKAVEQQVENSVAKLQALPSGVLKAVKQQVRQEMYREICQEWLEENQD